MADEIENENDVLELGAPSDQDTQPAAGADDGLTVDDDIEVPTFGDPGDEDPNDADLVKHLRSQIRDRDKRLADVEKAKQPEPAIVVGDKPTLESCDYDEEKFEAELDAYKDRKRNAEAQANKGREAQLAADEQWEQEKATFTKKRAALPYKDIDEAESTVAAALEPAQTALIVKVANDAPKLIYALGKNPAKLAALAGVKDPIKFIAATVRLEGEMKMAKRRPSVEPEKIVRGSAPLAAAQPDKQEAKLLAEAQRTGNMTPYRDHMRAKRKAAA